MKNNKDFSSLIYILPLIVVAVLLAISFIPEFKLGGIAFKRANIISDVISPKDLPGSSEKITIDSVSLQQSENMFFSEQKIFDSIGKLSANTYSQNLNAVNVLSMQDSDSTITLNWNISNPSTPKTDLNLNQPKIDLSDMSVINIEDFGDSTSSMANFNKALQNTSAKTARVAVFGDSFIEADILVADLREQLQDAYGGSGVGFVPFATPLSQYRSSVTHKHSDWTVYNIRDIKKIPENKRTKFMVSGLLCSPAENALTTFEGVAFRKHLDHAKVARIVFINEKNTHISVVINKTEIKEFTPESSTALQQIVINGDIKSITISLKNTDGFIGYGIYMEDNKGVSVDNYSIRGNSGSAIFATNVGINSQLCEITPYNLIILQYGLNVMNANITKYDWYTKSLVNIIKYVKNCFPQSSIIVMSVGDRCQKVEGEYVTMQAVHGMIEAQRNAAKQTKVAFWNTFKGMEAEGGMAKFVKNKWASKDYTHIGYGGGKQIATRFAEAILYSYNHTKTQNITKKNISITESTHLISPFMDSHK